jgi:hypothetical protein
MSKMSEEVKVLIEKIDDYLDGKIGPEELEQATMSLISDGNFDTLNRRTQDTIYTLDNKELNELSRDQIKEIRNDLEKYVVSNNYRNPKSQYGNGIEKLRAEKYPECEPLAEQLKFVYKDRWVRFHSLDKGKRYPENEEERQTVLKCHLAVLESLGADDLSFVITWHWAESPVPSPNVLKEQDSLYSAVHWKTLLEDPEETEPEFETYRHLFLSRHRLGGEVFNEILRAVSNDEIGGVIIAPQDLSWLYHPYDGGADVIVGSAGQRDTLKEHFKDWVATGPGGL